MAFKMNGFTPYDKIKTKEVGAKEPSAAFQKTDSPEKENEIKKFIKNNMNNMSDNELINKVNSMSDGETEYNWDKETGTVESRKKDDSEEESVYGSEGGWGR